MKLTILGCGDAFGSGGRLQSCYHVESAGRQFLIDCGATAVIGLNRLQLDANAIGTIFISHLHGDHYAGLVWWMIHAQHVTRRTEPLTVVGPPGLEQRFLAAAEALFPGSTTVTRRHALTFVEIRAGEPATVDGVKVTAREVVHPSGAPSHALRFEVGGKVLAFSGDTEWVDALLGTAEGADLFMIECYGFESTVRYHMNWKVISQKLPLLKAKRVLLVHMNREMLAQAHRAEADGVIVAEDGMSLVI